MTTQHSTKQPDVDKLRLIDELTQFRENLEEEAGMPICELEVNGALLLLDLCTFLKLGNDQNASVLGASSTRRISAFMGTTVTTTTLR